MPQEQPLISVIVPVYKVEAYLDPCVESIINQTYRNLEIILVDDGSPDRCPEMCDAWAAKDSRIKVVHKKNGGASDARNAGLDVFLGDYVTFVDSDDILYKETIEVLWRSCEKWKTNLAMCPLFHFSSETKLPMSLKEDDKALEGKFICSHLFVCNAAMPAAKLFRASLLRNHRFMVGRRVGEDAAFNYPIFFEQPKVAFVNSPMYFYRERSESVMGSYKLVQLEELDTFQEMLRFYREHESWKIYNAMALEYYARILAHEAKMKKYAVEDADAQERLLREKKTLAGMENLSPVNKLFFACGNLFPGVFRKFFFGNQERQKRMYGGC